MNYPRLLQGSYVNDPVYSKLSQVYDAKLSSGSTNEANIVRAHQGRILHGFLDLIAERKMDERTYTALHDSSPQRLAYCLYDVCNRQTSPPGDLEESSMLMRGLVDEIVQSGKNTD